MAKNDFTLPARIQHARDAMVRARAQLSDYLRYSRSQKPRFYDWAELDRLADSVAVATSEYFHSIAAEAAGARLEEFRDSECGDYS
jgi:hypothetical protein